MKFLVDLVSKVANKDLVLKVSKVGSSLFL